MRSSGCPSRKLVRTPCPSRKRERAEAAQRAMDGGFRAGEARFGRPWVPVRGRRGAFRAECGPGVDSGDVTWKERGYAARRSRRIGRRWSPATNRTASTPATPGGGRVQGVYGDHGPGFVLPICCPSFNTPWTPWTVWTTRAREPARNAVGPEVS